MTATDAPPIDLLDPDWWVDLEAVHEFFAWARAEAPAYRDANGYWVVTRHADIVDVERRSDVFSSRGSYRANIAEEESNTIALDDPEHLAQRRLVSRRFTPRAVEDHTAFLTSRIDELMAAVASAAASRWSTTSPRSSHRGSPPTCSGSPRSGGGTSCRGPSA
jgi:cytochrome P450